MKKLMESKLTGWILLILIILFIGFTFKIRIAWWAFIDVFFLFMMAFTHLLALYLGGRNRFVAGKLDSIAFWCGVLGVIALIVEYFLLH